MLGNGPAIDLQKMPILATKKNIFSDEAHFDLGENVNKKNCRIWGTENPQAYIEKLTHPKQKKLGNFSSKMSKESPLQSMVVVIGPC